MTAVVATPGAREPGNAGALTNNGFFVAFREAAVTAPAGTLIVWLTLRLAPAMEAAEPDTEQGQSRTAETHRHPAPRSSRPPVPPNTGPPSESGGTPTLREPQCERSRPTVRLGARNRRRREGHEGGVPPGTRRPPRSRPRPGRRHRPRRAHRRPASRPPHRRGPESDRRERHREGPFDRRRPAPHGEPPGHPLPAGRPVHRHGTPSAATTPNSSDKALLVLTVSRTATAAGRRNESVAAAHAHCRTADQRGLSPRRPATRCRPARSGGTPRRRSGSARACRRGARTPPRRTCRPWHRPGAGCG